MPTLVELAHDNTDIDNGTIAHLSALVSEWGMLADFCFADMLLYLPVSDGRWLISAQVRAATGQTETVAQVYRINVMADKIGNISITHRGINRRHAKYTGAKTSLVRAIFNVTFGDQF